MAHSTFLIFVSTSLSTTISVSFGINLKPKFLIWTLCASFLEGYARFLGYYDLYIKKEKHYIWNIAESAKIN